MWHLWDRPAGIGERLAAWRRKSACLPGYEHYWLRESDGAMVCQVCGAVRGRQR
jgi:hypothetical protein